MLSYLNCYIYKLATLIFSPPLSAWIPLVLFISEQGAPRSLSLSLFSLVFSRGRLDFLHLQICAPPPPPPPPSYFSPIARSTIPMFLNPPPRCIFKGRHRVHFKIRRTKIHLEFNFLNLLIAQSVKSYI
jgi:hypothetical protein